MSFLGKEYSFVKQEDFDKFLKTVGVPEDKIAALESFTPSQTLTQDGDTYTFHTTTPEGPQDTTFQSGVEFDDVIGPQKVPIKNMFVVDGNTVTQTVRREKREVVFLREYTDDDLVVTITSKDWDGTAKRYYKAN